MLNQKKYRNITSDSRFQYILILLSSFFLSLTCEYIFRGSLVKAIIWMFSNPILFLSSLLIVSSITLLLTSAFNSYRIALSITSTLMILFSVINSMKFNSRGIPLIPSDFYLNDEIFTIINVVLTSKFIELIALSIISIAFIIFLIANLPKLNFKARGRFISFAVSTILLFSFINTNILKNDSLVKDNTNALESGLINYFVSNINPKPINLSLEYIINDISTLKEYKIDSPNSNNVKPNIIVIMSEAFWDPSIMKEVSFSSPTTPNINKLKPTSIYGYLESPTFGGGTANTEFEFLTGNSIHFFNPGYMVYSKDIREPIIALPSILKNQGYTCKAIHPFKNWYWNRQEVYKHMGFDEYKSEEYLTDPMYKGFFVSDEHVTDLIIEEMTVSDDPLFIFAVTMQNHGPFDDNRYKGHVEDIKVSAKVSSESLRILQTYTQGVYDADKAFGKLTDYCSRLSKPTIVLFFGDHLPLLGKNYRVYKETGFISENSVNHENSIKLTSVPFILWSNYKTESQDLGLLNTSFMGPYLLDYAGLEMPNYFKFLQSFSEQLPVISRPYAIDKEENVIESNSEKYMSYNNDYLLVQQNILYEDKVFEDNYNKWIVKTNPEYNSNLNSISIEDVTIQENKTIIRGNNFYPKSILFINNRAYKYKYVKNNEIHINKSILKSGSKLQIKLFDCKNNLLAKSNTYIY